MNQNMHILQSQHIQFLTQLQQGRPCQCSTGIRPNPNNHSPDSPGFAELYWQHQHQGVFINSPYSRPPTHVPTVPPYA